MKRHGGYFIKINKKENAYTFQLWYTNKQEMGDSAPYNTQEACAIGVKKFKEYLECYAPTEENGLAEVIKLDNRKYIYRFYSIDGDVLYTSRVLESKQGCKKSLESTCQKFAVAEIK